MMEFFKVPKEIKRKLKEEARNAAKGLQHPSLEGDDDGGPEVLDLPERSSGAWAGEIEGDPLRAAEKWEDVIIYGSP